MPRPDSSKQKWIEKGYEHFALYGPENISINAISKEIGSPRASFYHHFSDLEVFINLLLEKHLEAIKSFVQEGKEYCNCLLPDFYQLLEKYPLGLKFHRQIFMNRHIPILRYVFSEVHIETSKEFVLDLFVFFEIILTVANSTGSPVVLSIIFQLISPIAGLSFHPWPLPFPRS